MNAELAPRAGLGPSRRMRARFLREVGALKLDGPPMEAAVVAPADLAPLPATARRFMTFMGVLGRPRTWSVRAHARGAFRLGPDKPWMRCEAWQFDTCLGVSRVFHMRLRYGGVVPMIVRDTYLDGKGHMLGRVLDAFSVVDETDDHVTTGELVTYLNDAVLLAPSMLLRPEVTWTEVDDASFDVSLTDRGRTVRARVFVDRDGFVSDFSTTDRFIELPGADGAPRWTRARWTTPTRGLRTVHGRTVAHAGEAVWHLPEGDFAYADLSFDRVEFDVPPAGP